MQYRRLGKTGLQVSPLCFGTMTFGHEADEDQSAALYHHCRDAGINFFDCADVYSEGRAEEILGRLVKPERQNVIITSKAYFPISKDVNARGATRRHLLWSVEQSLRRLDTDRIDLYFIHRFDDFTPLDETLRVLDDLVSQGKILYPAASNFAAWQVEKALGLSAVHDWSPLAVLQPMYNLVKRQAEVEILPMALAESLGVIPYGPMGGGLLSGKYTSTQKPEKGRLVENKMYQTRYEQPWVYEVAEKFSRLAAERGYHPAALAVAWVGSHPAVTAPIIGARNIEQLEQTLQAADIQLSVDDWQAIASLSPEPPPATDRNEERTAFQYRA